MPLFAILFAVSNKQILVLGLPSDYSGVDLKVDFIAIGFVILVLLSDNYFLQARAEVEIMILPVNQA